MDPRKASAWAFGARWVKQVLVASRPSGGVYLINERGYCVLSQYVRCPQSLINELAVQAMKAG